MRPIYGITKEEYVELCETYNLADDDGFCLACSEEPAFYDVNFEATRYVHSRLLIPPIRCNDYQVEVYKTAIFFYINLTFSSVKNKTQKKSGKRAAYNILQENGMLQH